MAHLSGAHRAGRHGHGFAWPRFFSASRYGIDGGILPGADVAGAGVAGPNVLGPGVVTVGGAKLGAGVKLGAIVPGAVE